MVASQKHHNSKCCIRPPNVRSVPSHNLLMAARVIVKTKWQWLTFADTRGKLDHRPQWSVKKLGVIFSWSADNERMLREVGSWGEWLLAYWQSWSLWWCVYNSRERPPLPGQSESGHQGVNTWRVTLREFNRALRWFMTNNKWHWIMHVIPGETLIITEMICCIKILQT